MKKVLILIVAILILSVGTVDAHSGRTDSNGGHNCNVGACAGTYHYHNGGTSGSSNNYSAPAPRVPVVTKRVLNSDHVINFYDKKEYTSKEYFGYSKLVQEGSNGVKRLSTEVTYTDGAESGRGLPSETIVTPSTDRITINGNRISPEAKITMLEKTKKKNKYNVYGEYSGQGEVVLSIDGKKVKRAKVSNGKFVFKEIKIKKPNVELIIHKRVNKKENQISEKTFAQLSNTEIKTEYSVIHEK